MELLLLSISVLSLFVNFLVCIAYDWLSIQKFCSSLLLYIQPQSCPGDSKVLEDNEKQNKDSDSSNQQCCSDKKVNDRYLHREEVTNVMEDLGIFCSPESEELKELMGSDELSGLFDEKEPSLEEVKEAFDVFDENRDGFIDAEELQRVLRRLDIKERCDLQNCRKMIQTYDENGDGRIDFNEFVRFMENSFC